MTFANDIVTDLATSLVSDMVQVGVARLRAFVSGSPEEQALRRCY
ncbi:hypothetical protein [Chloroflexus aggregans]|nr:hypothetical protein [Chloroflexus aggregans]